MALQRALKVEQAVTANNFSITDNVITGVQEELKQRDAERQRMRQHTKEVKWQNLEEAFQRKLWEHYTEAHRRGYGRSGTSTPEDLREVWQNGELKSLLLVEKQGWGRSQRADLQHLEAELEESLGKSIEALEGKLKKAADPEPECLQQIRSMAEEAKQELEKITSEIQDSSEAAIDQRQLQQRFANAKRLARKLWQQMPLSEAHHFLAQVSQSLAKSEPAAASGLVKVYETELKRLGALPLVHHARSPELLQCWTAS
eukprot:Skav201685  [mRNA]  locus=scaffold641:549419:554139:- [translate_table: standard]